MLPDAKLLPNYITKYRNLDLGTTGQVVKSAPCEVHDWLVSNNTNGFIYVKWYNKATAATSSDTPIMTLGIPGGWVQPTAVADPNYYSVGLSIRCTTGVADNDTTSPAANGCIINISYK